jgi:hypothetical protein
VRNNTVSKHFFRGKSRAERSFTRHKICIFSLV